MYQLISCDNLYIGFPFLKEVVILYIPPSAPVVVICSLYVGIILPPSLVKDETTTSSISTDDFKKNIPPQPVLKYFDELWNPAKDGIFDCPRSKLCRKR